MLFTGKKELKRTNGLYMLLYPTEMNIQFMQMLQKSSKRCAFGHLSKGIDILGEALATVAILAVGAGDIGMCVVDIAREEDAGVDLPPIGSHLLAVLTTSIEVGHLVGAKNIVHVLGQLSLKRGHHGELLSHENLGEQVVRTGEHHGLLIEVLNEGSLSKELRHVADLVASLTGEHLACSGKDRGTYEHGHIRKVGDEFFHQRQVLRAIILCRNMNLQESDIDIAQVIEIPLRRVADEEFALRIVLFQPILQSSAYEATSDNSNVNLFLFHIRLTFMRPNDCWLNTRFLCGKH